MDEFRSKSKVLWRASRLGEASHIRTAVRPRFDLPRLCAFTSRGDGANPCDARANPAGERLVAYHAHLVDEEWCYVVSGKGIAEMTTPSTRSAQAISWGSQLLKPRTCSRTGGQRIFVYLMGGERHPVDVVEYPHLGKRYALIFTPTGTEFYELGSPVRPFGRRVDP